MKKSNVYTTTGDNGTTSLVGGKRVMKTDIRLEAYGTVDELNSVIGYLTTTSKLHTGISDFLRIVQNKLFNIGAYLATDNPMNSRIETKGLSHADVAKMEEVIDRLDEELPPLSNFVLPCGNSVSSMAHICRTITRRCERRVIALADTVYVDNNIITYLNRLSDFFFVLARFTNVQNQIEEIFWDKDC
ncbi:MAG: cob(I)yrinic acid a,c-diamide adenosyltransferase [Muribaculaceae bacterium]